MLAIIYKNAALLSNAYDCTISVRVGPNAIIAAPLREKEIHGRITGKLRFFTSEP